MVEKLFRNEVIEAGRDRLTGAVIAAVPPSSRLYTRLVCGAAAVLMLILTFGGYATTADVRGVIAYDTGIARVYPRTPAEVRQLHVRSGQWVEAGQPIATLAIAQGMGGVDPQMRQLSNQDVELQRQLELALSQSAAEGSALDLQRANLNATITSLERQRAIAAGQIGIAESAAHRAGRLAKEGAGTQRQVEDSRSSVLARRAELEALEERIIAQRDTLRANDSDRSRRQIELHRSQSVLTAQRASLAEQRASLSRSDQIVLTAPVSGAVGDISVEIGQQALPDRSLASIVPSGSSLEVWLYAPSRAVGNARPGQRVRLLFDAFPYQKYGSGEGVVTEIARVSTEAANVDPGLKIDEPVFKIKAKLLRFAPRTRDGAQSLRPGMTLSGKLILERRSLWQIMFGPISEAFST